MSTTTSFFDNSEKNIVLSQDNCLRQAPGGLQKALKLVTQVALHGNKNVFQISSFMIKEWAEWYLNQTQ